MPSPALRRSRAVTPTAARHKSRAAKMTNTVSTRHPHRRRGHTLMELVVAMAAGSCLIAGLGSVMFIGRQIAYTPTNSTRRTTAADVVSQICDELRYATYVIQQTPKIIEFVV